MGGKKKISHKRKALMFLFTDILNIIPKCHSVFFNVQYFHLKKWKIQTKWLRRDDDIYDKRNISGYSIFAIY